MEPNNDQTQLFQTLTNHIARNPRLREPQWEAYLAVKKHFQGSREPALVQIPVGGGKTGLISILPFGISNGRVLIVAPNLTIRDAIFAAVDSASPKCFWRTNHVAATSPIGPFAAVLDGPTANYADCIDSHFVVTNVQQIGQAGNRWLKKMPPDFFDMILLDEGHHNAANSWQRLLIHFPDAKIVSLTATPFRSDEKEITGVPIYRYSFQRAMNRGYIKTLRAEQVSPCEISFTFGDSSETATLDEVIKLREEAWFSRGVALADECNRNIVANSVAACEKLRSSGKFHHQVIAVACSVEHAQSIAALYREVGYEAAEIHSKQTKAVQRHVLARLRQKKLDAIIQVQMLGEGFDHPPLSVAAIFRPFRSLSPYVQFVGRIMRVVAQDAPGHDDNRGIVISHVGLNTERHWDQFRQLDVEDQALWASIIRGPEAPDTEPKLEENFSDEILLSDVPPVEMLVEWERIGEGQISNYAALNPLLQNQAITNSIGDVMANAAESQTQPLLVPAAMVVGPQERRRQAKSRLKHQVDNAVRNVLNQTRLHAMGGQVSRVHPMLRSQKNWAASRYWMYFTLNQRLGRRPKSGSEWNLEEVEQANDLLPELEKELVAKISQRKTGRYF